MATTIERLAAARREIADAARLAREFARRHAFEITFSRRARHLIESSRLKDDVKRDALRAMPA
jgi:hypothetical protein